MRTTNKEYRKDLWLFIMSVIVLLYMLYMNYAYVNQTENSSISNIFGMITIAMIIVGSVVPIVVVFRFISKKTQSRTLSMMAVLLSLVTAIIIGNTSF